jgi:hypothetical protein
VAAVAAAAVTPCAGEPAEAAEPEAEEGVAVAEAEVAAKAAEAKVRAAQPEVVETLSERMTAVGSRVQTGRRPRAARARAA